MMAVTSEALRDGVIAVHWGGREQKFLKMIGVPVGVFKDGLQFVRYMLRAKGNGAFEKDVKYGYQVSLALAFFIMCLSATYQTHKGYDDAKFTVKFLMGFVKGLEHRRNLDSVYQAMKEIYKAPSLSWSPRKKAKRVAPAGADAPEAKKVAV